MRNYSQVQRCSHYLEQRECHPAQTRRRDAQLFAVQRCSHELEQRECHLTFHPDPAVHFHADTTDPTFHFDADTGPTFHCDADSDTAPILSDACLELLLHC
jgi:hypothetical protein